MKVILSMAITANGMIAGKNNEVDWVSKGSWKVYLNQVRKIGNAVVGRRTYEIMPDEEFLPDCHYVVLTSDKNFRVKKSNVTVVGTPKEAVGYLKDKGFKKALILGGGKLNCSFMMQGLIDEIYLDVHPHILGEGISLFAPADFEYRLELLGVKKLSPQIIQLHYQVKK